jgi:XTP/dITP diphosphohydrolase
MQRLVIATTNLGKIKEIKAILADLPLEVLSMAEAGIQYNVKEDGETFLENALTKAKTIYHFTRTWVLADDSGLEIDALDKAPGVYSARYLGKDTPYAQKNEMILEKLKDIPDSQRTARFKCAMALVGNEGVLYTTEGTLEGSIGDIQQGSNGFGYDPIFYPSGSQKSLAEFSPEEKNAISHRAQALTNIKAKLRELMN